MVLGKSFAAGHDKIAEAALMALRHGGSVAQLTRSSGHRNLWPLQPNAFRALWTSR